MPIYTSPVPPPRTYPCGHCGKLIPRAMAMRQAGYCDACEWMTSVEVQRLRIAHRQTLRKHLSRGALPLYHRADVEQFNANMVNILTRLG